MSVNMRLNTEAKIIPKFKMAEGFFEADVASYLSEIKQETTITLHFQKGFKSSE